MQVMTAKKRYEVGLSKLATTESSVAGMQEELIALQPQLEESTKQTEAALVVIERETAEADKVKKVCNRFLTLHPTHAMLDGGSRQKLCSSHV